MHKNKLTESDICDKFIRPAMEQAGWSGMAPIFCDDWLRHLCAEMRQRLNVTQSTQAQLAQALIEEVA